MAASAQAPVVARQAGKPFYFNSESNLTRIGRKKRSHARYYLRSQREIDRFLRALLELRRD